MYDSSFGLIEHVICEVMSLINGAHNASNTSHAMSSIVTLRNLMGLRRIAKYVGANFVAGLARKRIPI
jgi:hypothetical protein